MITLIPAGIDPYCPRCGGTGKLPPSAPAQRCDCAFERTCSECAASLTLPAVVGVLEFGPDRDRQHVVCLGCWRLYGPESASEQPVMLVEARYQSVAVDGRIAAMDGLVDAGLVVRAVNFYSLTDKGRAVVEALGAS